MTIAVVAALVAAELLSGSEGEAPRSAPALPRQVLSGPPASLASLRGKPALINFWASWCAPCKREAPELEAVARSLHGRARLVGVDWNDTEGGARAFVAEHGWTFSVLRDPSGATGAAYRLRGLPTTFALDSAGRIRATLTGPQTEASLRHALVVASTAGR